MNDKKSFEEKIAEDLTKTGLPTEIKVHKMLFKRGWNVKSQYSFIDNERSIRSCDFNASFYGKLISDDSDERYICQLFIECKKSDKPWVFYTGPEPEYHLEEKLAALFEPSIYKRKKNVDKLYYGLEKIKNIHSNVHSAIAYSYQIPFTNSKNSDTYKGIFITAEMQVLKAIYNTEPLSYDKMMNLYLYPLIIFDGDMFNCDLLGDTLKISRINYVRYASSGIPESKIDVLIDVITLDYLVSYLTFVEDEVFS